jgi:hypothetical protein
VLESDAARLRLARAQREDALQDFLELQHLVRLLHLAGGEARQLLADHARLARPLDFVAQRAQPGAVDLAGRGEDVDALERRGQRLGDLDADLRHELVPAPLLARVDRIGDVAASRFGSGLIAVGHDH